VAEPVRVHAVISSLTCGGAEVLLAELAAVAGRAGINLSVGYLADVAGSPIAARLRTAGVDPMPVTDGGGPGRLLRPAVLRAVRRQIARVRPDLVHTHLEHADLLGGVAARSLGTPWLSTVHASSWEGSARERAWSRLAAGARRGADRVIFVSEPARDAYLARLGRRSRARLERRIEVVPNGIGGQAETEARMRMRASLGLSPSERLVVLSAPLRLEKGHLRSFAALRALPDPAAGRTRAVVLGDGPDRETLQAAAAPLDGAVRWLGHREDVMRVLAAADVVLHTPDTDALPNGLIEAAAAGLPVVATSVGGIPEIVEDGRTGVLLPPEAEPRAIADALARVVGDAELRGRMGAAARRRFERRFAAEPWARRLRRIYEAVLEERSG
jgi:glycosyltransferase involved in cell wall biosynthesis